MELVELLQKLEKALNFRETELTNSHTNALRLFNGFYEGYPGFAVDLYAKTIVFQWYDREQPPDSVFFNSIIAFYQERLSQVQSFLLKNHFSGEDVIRRGVVLAGREADHSIIEWNVQYHIDLFLNRDCSFYLDSASVRKWLIENSKDKRVLNTFAYTGIFGIAALAGDAQSVTQTDLNKRFMNLFAKGAEMSRFEMNRSQIIPGDFFRVIGRLRKENRLFDTVILDPPFFSTKPSGTIDQLQHSAVLVNKIRPLVADDGIIVVMNNALYLSGEAFMEQMNAICGPYLQTGEMIPVPESFIGKSGNWDEAPVSFLPFNHSTKIMLLHVRRKDGRKV